MSSERENPDGVAEQIFPQKLDRNICWGEGTRCEANKAIKKIRC